MITKTEHPMILQLECLINQLLDLVHLEAGSISMFSIKFTVYNPPLHIVQKRKNWLYTIKSSRVQISTALKCNLLIWHSQWPPIGKLLFCLNFVLAAIYMNQNAHGLILTNHIQSPSLLNIVATSYFQ